MTDRYREIRDTMTAFMEECREHDSGYAMAAGYLRATVCSLLDSVPRSRLDQELNMMREFVRDRSHQRIMAALRQRDTV